jgi:outer membrane lipoprotein-sorting protein
LFSLVSLALSVCVARRRAINRPGAKRSQPLLVADRNTLLRIVSRPFQAVRDFSATVDMIPALGTTEKSKITEYKDVRGYIRFQKPAQIRIIGLYPVVRNKAFDMVSDGSNFKLYVPIRNRFIIGKNQIEQPSPNRLENLRPQHFLEALLVQPVDGENGQVMVENFTDEENAFYILHEVRANGSGQLRLNRTVWIDRLTLQISRQLIFDTEGNILTDARYSDWQAYDNVPFPKHIEINRPRDEYGVVIDIVNMDINEGVPPEQFVLEQPEGSVLQVVGQSRAAEREKKP